MDMEDQSVFNTGQFVSIQNIEKAVNFNSNKEFLCIAAIPNYLVYDRWNDFLDVVIV